MYLIEGKGLVFKKTDRKGTNDASEWKGEKGRKREKSQQWLKRNLDTRTIGRKREREF